MKDGERGRNAKGDEDATRRESWKSKGRRGDGGG